MTTLHSNIDESFVHLTTTPRVIEERVSFTEFGFFKEYYVDNKYIGQHECEKDRETYGYPGRVVETLSEDVFLNKGKKIKKGTQVTTIVYPLNGPKI